jgi:hypothetical protein
VLDDGVEHNAIKRAIRERQGLGARTNEGHIDPCVGKPFLGHHEPAERDVDTQDPVIATRCRHEKRSGSATDIDQRSTWLRRAFPRCERLCGSGRGREEPACELSGLCRRDDWCVTVVVIYRLREASSLTLRRQCYAFGPVLGQVDVRIRPHPEVRDVEHDRKLTITATATKTAGRSGYFRESTPASGAYQLDTAEYHADRVFPGRPVT